MLFVARSDTGEIEFEFEKTDILKLMRDILKEQAPTIKQNGQKLIRLLESKPVYVNADARYLRMAIENLLSNATKYTEAGGVITVTLKRTKTRATIKVEDTGVGVHEKYNDLLFRKFSRVPNALSNQVSGSGIGLYLAKKVADAHKGKIVFKSADGKGSVCTITLPLL
jgi:signal transduction histidine kinase